MAIVNKVLAGASEDYNGFLLPDFSFLGLVVHGHHVAVAHARDGQHPHCVMARLVQGDFAANLKLLQRYPPVDAHTILQLAEGLGGRSSTDPCLVTQRAVVGG